VVVSVGEKKQRLSKGEFVLSMAWMANKSLRITAQTASLELLEAAGADKISGRRP